MASGSENFYEAPVQLRYGRCLNNVGMSDMMQISYTGKVLDEPSKIKSFEIGIESGLIQHPHPAPIEHKTFVLRHGIPSSGLPIDH